MALVSLVVGAGLAWMPGPARALEFFFSFESDLQGFSPNTAINTPGTISGTIGGLVDNSTGPATSVILTGFPAVFNATFGTPAGSGAPPPIDILPLATIVDVNSFTLVDGVIVNSSLVLRSDVVPGPFWSFFISCGNFCANATPPEPDFNLLFDVSNGGRLAANSLGSKGVSFTPVPGPLPILGAGAAFAASRRLRRRLRSRAPNRQGLACQQGIVNQQRLDDPQHHADHQNHANSQ
jgi:hypothetical protein